MALFERRESDGRLIVRSRDEEFVVSTSDRLATAPLRKGDALLWDRESCLALEIVPRSLDTSYFLEDTPDVRFADIGGLDEPIAALKRSLELHFHHRETVERYRLRRRGSVLLAGAPGTGKTMMAKALANWLAELAPSKRARFMNIKPQSLHSSWYGESERQYRRVFEIGREVAEREPETPVVMFFDEVDAIGGRRAAGHTPIDDRVQTAFMAELDGLESRGAILIVSATNRRDAIDPALLRPGRLGDLVIEIPRPRRDAARSIYTKYFTEAIPYATSRDDVVGCAVSRLYAPNGETELARVLFRDGTEKTVRAADLVSGAVIANIAEKAIEHACVREISGGAVGLSARDVVLATNEELDNLARTLTPANCRSHVLDLPQDVDVVQLEPVDRTRARAFEYVSVT
jgi:proteasome-associated ATPase